MLKAGGVSVHHPNIIHGSEREHLHRSAAAASPSATSPPAPASAPGDNERWASAFLLRGEAVPGVNDYHPFPRYVEGEHMPFRGSDGWK